MTNQNLLQQFHQINTWKQKGVRAPHKPLLMLLALGEIQRGNTGYIPFSVIKRKFTELLADFGRPRKTIHPTFPFIRLANDGLWQFNKPDIINSKHDYTSGYLLNNDLQGKFPDDVTTQLKKDPSLIKQLAEIILADNFPETIHNDILSAVGLDIELDPAGYTTRTIRKRDPQFRINILKAYEYRCAVCGFGVRLRNNLLAVEAAHIMWHQASGPDVEVNGLALCSTHHKLFDLGAFTLGEGLEMLVSDEVNGLGAEEWLINYHGKPLLPPQKKQFYPEPEFRLWHVREVFKGAYREV